jgi:hypothetical protein
MESARLLALAYLLSGGVYLKRCEWRARPPGNCEEAKHIVFFLGPNQEAVRTAGVAVACCLVPGSGGTGIGICSSWLVARCCLVVITPTPRCGMCHRHLALATSTSTLHPHLHWALHLH